MIIPEQVFEIATRATTLEPPVHKASSLEIKLFFGTDLKHNIMIFMIVYLLLLLLLLLWGRGVN